MPLSVLTQPQYIYAARMTVRPANGGQIKIENLTGRKGVRFGFDVTRSFNATENTPQKATIRVYNLAEDTRQNLQGCKGVLAPVPASWSKAQLLASDADRNYDGPDAITQNPEPLPGIELPPSQAEASIKFGYAYVILEAGYGGKVGQIFEGTMLIPRSKQVDATTIETTLEVGDGALGACKGIANTSFPEGTETLTVVRHLIRLLGVGAGNLDTANWLRVLAAGQKQATAPFLTSSKLAAPYSPSGQSAWVELAQMLEMSNVKWMIDAGDFFLLEPDGYLLGAPVDLGKPIGRIDEDGGVYSGTFLLNQNARPAGKITVNSPKFRGEWIARSVNFRGDTHGGGWYTIVKFSANDPLGLGL